MQGFSGYTVAPESKRGIVASSHERKILSAHPVVHSVFALHLNVHARFRDCHSETPPLPSLPTYLLNFNEPR